MTWNLLAAAAPFVDLKTGAAATMVATTLSVSRKYFVFAVLIGLLLEAFGKSPTDVRDYAACTWRAIVVLILLAFYPTIFGSVVNLTSDLAAQVTPPSTVEKLGSDYRARLKMVYAPTQQPDASPTKANTPTLPTSELAWRIPGGLLFDSVVMLLATLGLAITWLMTALAGLLITLFYILGPLALVFAVPRISDTGTRWFAEFVTFCAWPILSGLLLQITVSLGSHLVYGTGSGPITTIASALLMTASAIATPVLANRLVGGSIKSAAGHGAQTAASLAQKGWALSKRAFMAARAATGDPTAVAATAASAVVRPAPSNPPRVH